MHLGARLMEVEDLSCFIHTLQLVIHYAIFSQRAVKDLITKCWQIVGHFSHSALACQKLKDIQIRLELPKHKLIQAGLAAIFFP